MHFQHHTSLVTEEEVICRIQSLIDDYVAGATEATLLEAGCGSSSAFRFSHKILITGLDISQKALDSNALLHDRIRADIQEFTSNKQYDIAICWNVLEHLANPQKALDNLLQLTKEGGLIILAAPNVFSLKGLITKLTPHWFHTWVYKCVFMYERTPFRTYLRFTMSPQAVIERYINYMRVYEAYSKFALGMPYSVLYDFCIILLRIISIGAWSLDSAQYYFAFKKELRK